MAFADSQKDAVIVADEWGNSCYKVTLAGACRKGDVLGYSSGWKQAFGNVSGVIQGRLIALADGAIGDKIPVSDSCIIGGRYSGATIGNPIYVSEDAAGKVTETLPNTTNDATTVIGYVWSATEIRFKLLARIDSLSA